MKKKSMQGRVFHEIPGYLTPTEAAQRLGMSRQQFYETRLAEAMNRYKPGGSNVTLYAEEDVAALEHWLFTRQGLIALGLRRGNSPKAPTQEEFQAAQAGVWDAICPVCGGLAVQDPDTGRIWCPEHGVMEPEEGRG